MSSCSSSNASGHPGRPPLLIAKEEYWDLTQIGVTAPPLLSSVGYFLLREIDRARQVERSLLPHNVVRMYSRARYLDNFTARQRTVTIVYPGEECSESSLVSVLTPIGAALIGMSEGQRMTWTMPSGAERDITVIAVTQVDPDEVRNRAKSPSLSQLA